MNHLRLPFEFDVASLKSSLAAIPDDIWRESVSQYVSRDTYFEGELIEPKVGEFQEDGFPVFDFKPGIPQIPILGKCGAPLTVTCKVSA